MLRMPADELPVDALTELGRATWAAIKLEDYAEGICSNIDPADPRGDRRMVSTKFGDARKVLSTWPGSALRDEATAWLERARLALERRNAALHATPMVWVGPDRAAAGRLFLGEMPRKDGPYAERPLTVESMAELRSVLEAASGGWRELTIATGAAARSRRESGAI